MDLRMIEDEDQLNYNIKNSNNANWSMRADIVKVALACFNEVKKSKESQNQNDSEITTRFDIDPVYAFKKKVSLLKLIGIPVLNLDAPKL